METIYIETTVVSYLVANQPGFHSRRASATHSAMVAERAATLPLRHVTGSAAEASLGDAEMSQLRAEALAGLTVLDVNDSTRELARAILAEKILPPVALADSVHAVVAAQNRVDILLTWNCRHLANPRLLSKLRSFMGARGLVLPEVCTPVELMGG